MKIAILGLGCVGSGVYEQLQGRDGLTVARILHRHPLSGAAEEMRTEDFGEILADPEIEAVVEVLGGAGAGALLRQSGAARGQDA